MHAAFKSEIHKKCFVLKLRSIGLNLDPDLSNQPRICRNRCQSHMMADHPMISAHCFTKLGRVNQGTSSSLIVHIRDNMKPSERYAVHRCEVHVQCCQVLPRLSARLVYGIFSAKHVVNGRSTVHTAAQFSTGLPDIVCMKAQIN